MFYTILLNICLAINCFLLQIEHSTYYYSDDTVKSTIAATIAAIVDLLIFNLANDDDEFNKRRTNAINKLVIEKKNSE